MTNNWTYSSKINYPTNSDTVILIYRTNLWILNYLPILYLTISIYFIRIISATISWQAIDFHHIHSIFIISFNFWNKVCLTRRFIVSKLFYVVLMHKYIDHLHLQLILSTWAYVVWYEAQHLWGSNIFGLEDFEAARKAFDALFSEVCVYIMIGSGW